MPLQLFGNLLDFSFFGIFLVRFGVGLWFVASASALLSGRNLWMGTIFRKTKRSGAIGFLDGAVGVLLLFGLFTQGAALLGAALSLARVYKYRSSPANFFLFLLLTLACLALLTLGPGPFSVDLPL